MSKDVSIFSKNVFINGEVFSDDTLDISGKVNGTIISNKIAIKNGALIEGNVYANELSLFVDTKIKGNVFATKIKLSKNAEIEGDVSYFCISVDDGAKIIGKCCLLAQEKIEEIVAKKKGNLFEKQESK